MKQKPGRKPLDLRGQHQPHGKLRALKRLGLGNGRHASSYRWLCACDCGGRRTVSASDFARETIRHCGCDLSTFQKWEADVARKRRKRILAMRASGLSAIEIARDLRITRTRVYQLLKRGRAEQRGEP